MDYQTKSKYCFLASYYFENAILERTLKDSLEKDDLVTLRKLEDEYKSSIISLNEKMGGVKYDINNSIEKDENAGKGNPNRDPKTGKFSTGKSGGMPESKRKIIYQSIIDNYDNFDDRYKIFDEARKQAGLDKDKVEKVSDYSDGATIVYKGTDSNEPTRISSWKKFTDFNGNPMRETNSGLFLSPDKNYASQFGNKVYEFGINKKAKILDTNEDFGKSRQRIIDDAREYFKDNFDNRVKVTDVLTQDEGLVAVIGGYDGYKRGGWETVIVNRSVVEEKIGVNNSLSVILNAGKGNPYRAKDGKFTFGTGSGLSKSPTAEEVNNIAPKYDAQSISSARDSVFEKKGFNGLPKVSKEPIENPIYRYETGENPSQYKQDLMYSDDRHLPGVAVLGSGTYFSKKGGDSSPYSFGGGVEVRAKLSEKAKVAFLGDIHNTRNKLMQDPTLTKEGINLISDHGTLAALMGYDAMENPTTVIAMNRTKLIFEDI